MAQFVKGEVVVLPFPFSDLSGAKKRPALVLAVLDGEDLILCQITSVQRTDRYAIPLGNTDFQRGKLLQPSMVRPNRIFTAEASIVQYSIGIITDSKSQVVNRVIVKLLTG